MEKRKLTFAESIYLPAVFQGLSITLKHFFRKKATIQYPEQLRPFAAEMKMNYPVLQGLGRDDVTEAFGPIFGVPTTLIVSRDGKICATHSGMTAKETFETQIRELL